MPLPFRSPLVVVAGVLAIVIAMATAVWWLFSSNREVLFDKLDAAQLNNISAELDRAGIDYKIDREKSAIVIADKDARQARLVVMGSSNALRETTGFELFDKSDFGMTDFAQKINFQRAMEGEIARTVSALANIKYARVHLVLPEHSLFRNEKQKPRASVTVFVNHESTLTEEEVRGIQRITTSAVPDLGEQDVTVVNQSGIILSNAAAEDGSQVNASARLAQKQAVEAYVAEKVRKVLTPALGGGHFAVSVDVALDLNQKTTNTERVLEAGSNVGIKRLKESSNRNKNENGADDLQREVEYAVGHESEQVVHGSGEIKRLQVGVIVDNDVKDVDVAKIRELVATTAGVDVARGDKVAVVQNNLVVQKALAALDSSAPAPASALDQHAVGLGGWVVAALFVLGVIVGGAAMLVMTRARPRRLSDESTQRLRLELQQWLSADALESERL